MIKQFITLYSSLLLLCFAATTMAEGSIEQALTTDLRSTKNKARDQYRHPKETLTFFGLRKDMHVVEILPGSGWYTEILAPVLYRSGKLYAAHFPKNIPVEFFKQSRQQFATRIQQQPYLKEVMLTEFSASSTNPSQIAPLNSIDMILTFRNIHNWYMRGGEPALKQAFANFYSILKPGGTLGVVEHRLPETADQEAAKFTGYIKQSWAIRFAQDAGFKFIAASEINHNAKDTKDHPKGVWTLPPTLRLKEQDKEKYLAIGESDRMTLKFIKPKEVRL